MSPRTSLHGDVIARIAAYNRGRDAALVRRKYKAMANNPFAFYRGTAHLFYEDLDRRALPRSPAIWGCGDAHLENFGTFKADNGLTYFDLNDFDEAALLPLAWDLARMVTSIVVAGAAQGISTRERRALVRAFLSTYASALKEGRALWIERATAPGPIRTLLRRARNRTSDELLQRRTERRGGRLRLRCDGKRVHRLAPERRQQVLRLVRAGGNARGPVSLESIDAGIRVAGLASLGLARFIVLARTRTRPRDYVLLDIKEARRSAAAAGSPLRQPRWKNEADRIITLQHRIQAASPSLLAPVHAETGEWLVMRALQPTEDRLDVASIARSRRTFASVLETMAQIMAWSHLRGAAREGSANVAELTRFAARHRRWTRNIERFAFRYGARVEQDARTFAKAWKKGFDAGD